MKALAELLVGYLDEATSGRRPPTWDAGPLFDHVIMAPGRVILLAGPPGSAKTALVLSLVVEALERNPTLTAYLANVEMDPKDLMIRVVARKAGLGLSSLQQNAVLPKDAGRLAAALAGLHALGDRLLFAEGPFEFGRLIDEVEACGAGLVVIDYVQRIPAAQSAVPHGSERERLEGIMAACRAVAQKGRCAVVVSAVGRAKNGKGQTTYDGSTLTYANLRGSSELEFSADDVLILCPADSKDRSDETRNLLLKHEKSRHGLTRDKVVRFHRPTQRFHQSPGPPPT